MVRNEENKAVSDLNYVIKWTYSNKIRFRNICEQGIQVIPTEWRSGMFCRNNGWKNQARKIQTLNMASLKKQKQKTSKCH